MTDSIFKTTVACATDGCDRVHVCPSGPGYMPDEPGWVVLAEFGKKGGKLRERAFCSKGHAYKTLKAEL
jgi:hypothetical protein